MNSIYFIFFISNVFLFYRVLFLVLHWYWLVGLELARKAFHCTCARDIKNLKRTYLIFPGHFRRQHLLHTLQKSLGGTQQHIMSVIWNKLLHPTLVCVFVCVPSWALACIYPCVPVPVWSCWQCRGGWSCWAGWMAETPGSQTWARGPESCGSPHSACWW